MISARQIAWLQYLLLSVCIGFLYGPYLNNPLVFDDLNIYINGAPKPLDGTFSFFNLRSLPYASLVWTHQLFGAGISWPRLGNVLIHAVNSLTLLAFLRVLLQASATTGSIPAPPNKMSLTWATFLAALFFALHPIAVYATGYLVQRTILLATLFSLLMWLTLSLGLKRNHMLWLLVSLACYFLAVLSKEHSVMAPVIALGLVYFGKDSWKLSNKYLVGYFVACAAIAVYAALSAKGILGAVYEPYARSFFTDTENLNPQAIYGRSVITQSVLFFKYLGLWLVPFPGWMSVDMRESLAPQLLSGTYIAGFVLFLLYAVTAAWMLFQGRKLALFGLAMLIPWIQFIPEFSVMRVQEPFVLYRSYLWMPGLFIVLSLALCSLGTKWAVYISAAAAVCLFAAAVDRLATFSHPLLLWDDAASLIAEKNNVAGADRIYYNRAVAYSSLKLNKEALSDYDKVIEISPKIGQVYSNRGYIFYDEKKYREALLNFDNAIRLKPDYAKAYYGRGLCYEAINARTHAMDDFRKACELGMRVGCDRVAQ